MILSDRELRARLERGEIGIEPIEDLALQLQPASFDLRLDARFLTLRPGRIDILDPRESRASMDLAMDELVIPDGQAIVLHPGDFVLGSTIENVRVPNDLVARVEGRSSLGRLAIVVHATAGFVDPGFEGQITLEISNLGRCAVRLYPGMRVCQLVFHEMTSPAERPYGPARGSKYHGQRGPVGSRIARDLTGPDRTAPDAAEND